MADALVLASASPRRAELLASAGYAFTVDPADVDEAERPGERPQEYVLRVARDKARVVAARRRNPDEIVLAADTTVVAAGEILAKPADESEAVRMLELLAGGEHRVFTGVVGLFRGRELAEVVETAVRLLPLSLGDIQWYVGTGNPWEGRRLRDSGPSAPASSTGFRVRGRTWSDCPSRPWIR